MGKANRFAGYLVSVTTASIFYIAWFVFVLGRITPQEGHTSPSFEFGFALYFLLFEGMGAAFLLMALPWLLAVIRQTRLKRFGAIYFSSIGAALTFVISCATSSISPKPLFIEDQTFWEGFRIAIARQGICFVLTGVVFGLTYWFVSERLRHSLDA